MKKAVLGLLMIASLGCTQVLAAETVKQLRVGVEGAYPPFSEKAPDGSLKGFDIDIAYALCTHMEVKCVLVETGFDSMIPSLNVRKIDAVIASLSITEERKKSVNFSDKYYHTPSRMVAHSDAKFAVTTEGMSGKRIGVQRGTTHEKFAMDFFNKSQITSYAKQDEVFLDLVSGRLDAIVVDSVAADQGFLKTPRGKAFAFIGPAFTDPKYFGTGAGIALRKSDTELLARVNKAIAEMRKDGTYKKIQQKYFSFDVYGE